jgi:hypothetical protein
LWMTRGMYLKLLSSFERRIGGHLIRPALHQDVEDVPILIDGPAEKRALAILSRSTRVALSQLGQPARQGW